MHTDKFNGIERPLTALYTRISKHNIYTCFENDEGNDVGDPFNWGTIGATGGEFACGWCECKEIFTNALLLLAGERWRRKHFVSDIRRMVARSLISQYIISYFNNNWSVISTILLSWYWWRIVRGLVVYLFAFSTVRWGRSIDGSDVVVFSPSFMKRCLVR